jgi:hypothetical protein
VSGTQDVLKGNCGNEILFAGRSVITSWQGNTLLHSSQAVILSTSENLGLIYRDITHMSSTNEIPLPNSRESSLLKLVQSEDTENQATGHAWRRDFQNPGVPDRA